MHTHRHGLKPVSPSGPGSTQNKTSIRKSEREDESELSISESGAVYVSTDDEPPLVLSISGSIEFVAGEEASHHNISTTRFGRSRGGTSTGTWVYGVVSNPAAGGMHSPVTAEDTAASNLHYDNVKSIQRRRRTKEGLRRDLSDATLGAWLVNTVTWNFTEQRISDRTV